MPLPQSVTPRSDEKLQCGTTQLCAKTIWHRAHWLPVVYQTMTAPSRSKNLKVRHTATPACLSRHIRITDSWVQAYPEWTRGYWAQARVGYRYNELRVTGRAWATKIHRRAVLKSPSQTLNIVSKFTRFNNNKDTIDMA